jgi:hypothetical protein
VIATALWVWSTWITHSMMSVKVPAQVWNAAPGAMVGIALLAVDAWRYPALAAAAIAGSLTPAVIEWWPSLSRTRELIPEKLPQTRVISGLVEGAVLMAVSAVVVYGLHRALRRPPPGTWSMAGASGLALLYSMLVRPPKQIQTERERHRAEMTTENMKVVGLALDRVVAKKSVLFQAIDFDPPVNFELQDLIFWSGRMVYRRQVDAETVRRRGYHPYIVSPVAEPFAPIAGIPAHASMRAYDLDAPAAPAPIPDGAMSVDVAIDGGKVVGLASGEGYDGKDRWVFFVRPTAVPRGFDVTFVTVGGPHRVRVEPEASLRHRASLANVPWFLVPAYGPRRDGVAAIRIGGHEFALSSGAGGT